jgi:hypothetical protein
MSAPSGAVEAFRMEPSLSASAVSRATGSGRSRKVIMIHTLSA